MDQHRFDELTEKSRATIAARVLLDSVAPNGARLTTFEWTYPRCIHAEIMTHRQLSKNSASSRAIPLAKMIERVNVNPFFPLHWGKNQRGMQADEELSSGQRLDASQAWLYARDAAVTHARELEGIGVHKQVGNRLLEPWMWITVIVSGTNFENLFALRCHPAAEPHFQALAYKARDAYDASVPRRLGWGEWHLPLFGHDGDLTVPTEDRPKVSAGRCARVSYLTHDGRRAPAEDVALFDRLCKDRPMHASPLEHAAVAHEDARLDYGNFARGWWQLRKQMYDECVRERVR
jgi:hypothetical protein